MGIVVGSIILVAVVVGAFLKWRRSKAKRESPELPTRAEMLKLRGYEVCKVESHDLGTPAGPERDAERMLGLDAAEGGGKPSSLAKGSGGSHDGGDEPGTGGGWRSGPRRPERDSRHQVRERPLQPNYPSRPVDLNAQAEREIKRILRS